jgi:hypothetical protein
MKRHASLLIAGIFAIGTAYAADGLQLKTGVWDVTYIVKMEGSMIPKSALEKMPPERRAAVEAAMKKRAAAPAKPRATKSCVTAEDLRKGAFDADPDSNCKKTLVSQTSTHQELKFVCTEDGETRTGRMTIDAPSSDRMQGNVEIVTSNGKVSTQLTGVWAGPTCTGKE